MTKKNFTVIRSEPPTTEQILASLRYLYNHCPSSEFKPVLKITLDLSHSLLMLDTEESTDIAATEYIFCRANFLTALQFLKNEAERLQLEDLDMVLDATLRLGFTMHYLQFRGEFVSAEVA